MKKTHIIIFSKDRTLQLKSLLLSAKHYSGIDEKNITILYKADSGISYKSLINEFKCEFVRQGNFLEDVKNIINGSKSEYIGFMVDDLIFYDSFSWDTIEGFMETRKDVGCFTLRLGRNIKRGNSPDFKDAGDGIITWDTARDQGKYWNYFWELCSSVYRRKLVMKYLARCRPEKERFPNPFEAHFYTCMPTTRCDGIVRLVNSVRFVFNKKSERVACFEKSKCFTQGVNLVADIGVERKEFHSIEELHNKMLKGYIADYLSLKDVQTDNPQPGPAFFKLVKEETPVNG
ncbi:MAG: hypothetical protein A2020_06270 [Lentisphaerae bacterium GWF2_45_14]|nr:MAG: hypothetical protein A2020_06270 [Lentisphaerae bacterium GWF2_45_14]